VKRIRRNVLEELENFTGPFKLHGSNFLSLKRTIPNSYVTSGSPASRTLIGAICVVDSVRICIVTSNMDIEEAKSPQFHNIG
jgi:hypothetical protein